MIKNSIIIRKATQNDQSDVYRMMCELELDTFNQDIFNQIFETNLDNSDCFYCVAEVEDKVIGFISLHIQQLLHHNGAVGEVQEFYIDQNYRGKGVGKLLMSGVKKCAKERNLKSLEVTSNKKRIENIKIYENFGFKLTHNKFTI